MPVVKVSMLRGKDMEYKKAILDSIHEALVEAMGIPDSDRIQQICEFEKDNFEYSQNRTRDFIIIELLIFKGRSYETKKNTYKAIADKLEAAVGIKRTDILIVINEQPLENWGIAGGKPASEVDLGFKVDV